MNRLVPLKSLCIKITDGSHYSPKSIKEGFAMLSVKDMNDNSFSYKNCNYISKEDYEKLKKADCKPLLNDLVIAKDGSYLKHVFVIKDEKEQAVLSSIGILRPNLQKIDPSYLKYYLQTKSVKETVSKKYVSGSALPRIILKGFEEISVIWKDINIQEKIAHILSNLDSKIELNNKINQELEDMAKLIYDYWFVQFDFPNEEGKPYKSSGGKMVYSDELKREIPEGWVVESIGNFGSVKKGTLITEKTANIKGSIKVVSAGINFSYFHDKSNCPENTITISASGANAGYINFWHEPIFANDCTTIRANSDVETIFILQFLRLIQKNIYQQSKGSAQPHVYPKDIESLQLVIPTKLLLLKYGKKVLNANKLIGINVQQNQKLAELREWLLPMLMNGQVTIK